MNFDLGIRCGYLLSMKDGATTVQKNVFVGVQGAKIAEVTPFTPAMASRSTKFIDASTKIVMPGLVNAHMHLPMSLLRGLAEDMPFMDWLTKLILPIEGKLLNEELARVGAELSLVESIRSGVTTVCDMYYFEDAVADVVDRFGMRGVLGEAVADFPTPDNKTLNGSHWKILDRMNERYRKHDRITPAVAPHAPYTCSDETLKACREYAGKNGLPLFIHVSESKTEADEAVAKFGKSPAKRLHDLGVSGKSVLYAHCVWLDESDRELMSKSGTSAVHCPDSNMKLGSGMFEFDKMLEAGITVALGTDGAASNNDLNLFREMDTGAKLQKLLRHGRSSVGAPDLLRAATTGGAKALGLDGKTGTIEPGKLADFIVISPDTPQMHPIYDVASQLVYASGGQGVETVVCNGRILMENSVLKCADESAIYGRVSEAAGRIQHFLHQS